MRLAVLTGLAVLLLSLPAAAEGVPGRALGPKSAARTPAGIITLKPIDVFAHPQKPVAAIDVAKSRLSVRVERRSPRFSPRIARSVLRQPL
jgi:hypothetical protein